MLEHPGEDEIERIDFAIGFGENGIFRSDVCGDDVATLPSEGGEHVVSGGRDERFPPMEVHPFTELAWGGIFANKEGLLKEEKASIRAEAVQVKTCGKMIFSHGEA